MRSRGSCTLDTPLEENASISHCAATTGQSSWPLPRVIIPKSCAGCQEIDPLDSKYEICIPSSPKACLWGSSQQAWVRNNRNPRMNFPLRSPHYKILLSISTDSFIFSLLACEWTKCSQTPTFKFLSGDLMLECVVSKPIFTCLRENVQCNLLFHLPFLTHWISIFLRFLSLTQSFLHSILQSSLNSFPLSW